MNNSALCLFGTFSLWLSLAPAVFASSNSDSCVAAPVPLLDMTSDLYVQNNVAPANGLTLDQEAPLDGCATLDLIYL